MNNKKAFTLIELLVVVLIIGILAAVALPQYEKAVFKSRIMGGTVLMSKVLDAAERYYLANGQYPISFKELDIAISCVYPIDDTTYEGQSVCWLNKDARFVMYFRSGAWMNINGFNGQLEGSFSSKRMFCYANKGKIKALAACASLGWKPQTNTNSAFESTVYVSK